MQRQSKHVYHTIGALNMQKCARGSPNPTRCWFLCLLSCSCSLLSLLPLLSAFNALVDGVRDRCTRYETHHQCSAPSVPSRALQEAHHVGPRRPGLPRYTCLEIRPPQLDFMNLLAFTQWKGTATMREFAHAC